MTAPLSAFERWADLSVGTPENIKPDARQRRCVDEENVGTPDEKVAAIVRRWEP